MDRRQFVIGAFGFTAALQLVSASSSNRTRVVLLGTKGGPTLSTNTGRSNSSTLLLINDVPYVVDCGYGVSRQLINAGVMLDRLRHIFITHLHSDHDLEYGTLFYNAWQSKRSPRVDAYGPVGLQRMTREFLNYMKFDIDTRVVDEGLPDPRKLIRVREFDRNGVIMQNEDVKVSALRVRHPPITQSYAYRFDTRNRSIAISGDTAYAPELAVFAKGVDVLIHEAMYLPAIEKLIQQNGDSTRLREHLLAAHTSTEDVGRIAAQAGIETLVLTHLVPGDDPSITDEQWSEEVRKHFNGKIIVGRDLIEI
ncbi:MAG TPA: MBL fold metallo-hydrolase [Pyrinomonadaceae bacterium]|jgi:ribonuclease BN (tRNA processing enzyme)|nr:MBL fold metallo-hydrolase [Pyrinomonadaceae bacterium]